MPLPSTDALHDCFKGAVPFCPQTHLLCDTCSGCPNSSTHALRLCRSPDNEQFEGTRRLPLHPFQNTQGASLLLRNGRQTDAQRFPKNFRNGRTPRQHLPACPAARVSRKSARRELRPLFLLPKADVSISLPFRFDAKNPPCFIAPSEGSVIP